MKPNRSRDGKYRASIRLNHRLALDDVVTVLCFHFSSDVDGTPESLTKTLVEGVLHGTLRSYGNETPYYWRDNVESDSADNLEKHLRSEVLRLYPTFNL